MARKYEMKARAERQEQTRKRIVEAAVELHTRLGPAHTSIKAVAERAGVQRHTVYRHFPAENDLLAACTAHWDAQHPFPDPTPWFGILDPMERLGRALTEIYAYFREVEQDLAMFYRDAALLPAMQEALAEEARQREALRDGLAAGWGARGARRRMLLAAIGHALEFETWRSLARSQEMSDRDAAALMVRLAAAAAAP